MTSLQIENKLIKRSTHDLGQIDPKYQFEYFADELCQVTNQCSCNKIGKRIDFPARFDVLDKGVNRAALIQAPPVNVFRTSKHIQQAEENCFFLNYVINGSAQVTNAEKRQSVSPGSIFTGDEQYPDAFNPLYENDQFNILEIRLGDQKLRNSNMPEIILHEKRFNLHRLVPLLRNTLHQLAFSLKETKDNEAEKLLTIAESIITMIAEDNEDFKNFRPSSEHIFNLIDAEISNTLSNPDLNLDKLAGQLQVSKRRIQRILAEKETTFTDFIRKKRLKHAYTQLRNNTLAHKSIAEIAFSCGYSEHASFHRAFKKEFGKTPGEIQREMQNCTSRAP